MCVAMSWERRRVTGICAVSAEGKRLDTTQEMIALGLSNICGSFFHAMPVTGSFSRTAVNYSSGVRTPFGGVFTGQWLIVYREGGEESTPTL